MWDERVAYDGGRRARTRRVARDWMRIRSEALLWKGDQAQGRSLRCGRRRGLGVCGEGTDLVEGVCVPLGDSSLPDRCGEGTELRDGVCVSTVERVECGEGTRLEDGTCVSTIAQTYFVGRFDGRGRAIRNLEVANPGGIGGLFYILAQGAVVQNLRLVDVDVVGGNSVGGLAGRLRGAWVYGVHVTGTINGKDYVGGLVGWAEDTIISASRATGEVRGRAANSGGLVGRIARGTISSSSAAVKMSATGDHVGGWWEVGRSCPSTAASPLVRSTRGCCLSAGASWDSWKRVPSSRGSRGMSRFVTRTPRVPSLDAMTSAGWSDVCLQGPSRPVTRRGG